MDIVFQKYFLPFYIKKLGAKEALFYNKSTCSIYSIKKDYLTLVTASYSSLAQV